MFSRQNLAITNDNHSNHIPKTINFVHGEQTPT